MCARPNGAGESGGALFKGEGSRSRHAGGVVRGAVGGDGGGDSGGVEGRGSVCTAGPELSGGTVGVHDSGQPAGGGVDAGEGGRAFAGDGGAGAAVGWGCGGVGGVSEVESWDGGGGTGAGASGVCDLHIGIDGQAQRGDGGASTCMAANGGDGSRIWVWGAGCMDVVSFLCV